ncbi:NYN domain-containing protein [Cellulomonas sp. P24]|uniref:NYN domain-containing protein n=1 Tax=Cellulomonas sp. P24 TaxID=2885206 RepID=UPI00216B3944|nr:NYN domain-containing protein [Cellulomonas sp. P24]MCR6491582.1 NYN domain-containing protein [Cellulomonas sp. P24]
MTIDSSETGRRLRCALFVDFDNVYIGLQRLDPRAAEAFASAPAHWLTALETGSDADGDFTRRFLVRACYLNPSVFSQFRPNFTRAGFSVVDCPSLTQQGKSSADINLVLDAVDALSAETRYDEFVILSADADFTPLALRCRAADRRVTIITAGPAASAYRAVADTVVTADELADLVKHPDAALEDAPASTGEVAPDTTTTGAERGRTATRTSTRATAPAQAPASPARKAVLRHVRSADKPLTGGVVAQVAQKADPSLLTSGWDGAGGFFPWLARAVPELGAASRPAPGFVWDPKRFSEADLTSATGVDLPPLQRQVVEVTDIPNLPTERYRVLLTALADDVRTTPFDRPETSRRVRDACQAAGAAVGRASVNTVISGVLYAGLDLAARPTAKKVAETWADNVIGLCRGARMELGPQDVAAIRMWVSGGLLTR